MQNSLKILVLGISLVVPALTEAQAQMDRPATGAPTIYSIEPASGFAGTRITIVGFGFSQRNTVRVGQTSVSDVPIAWQRGVMCPPRNHACHSGINQALVVLLPHDLTPGKRLVSVESANGTSALVTFTVVDRN